MNAMLKIENLSIQTDTQTLVQSLSLDLYPQRPLTILGETGAGKSLIAAAVAGTLPDALKPEGDITLFDELNPLNRERFWGKEIALLPQEPWLALNPLRTIGSQISEVHKLVLNEDRSQSDTLTHHALQQMDLGKDGDKHPFELSGGMAQRAAYLCATQAGGKLLIADEPTKGLDESRRDHVGQLLLSHCQQLENGKPGGLLTITHDIKLAKMLGGDIIVMKEGAIVERGDAKAILDQPQAAYTKALIQAQPEYWSLEQPASSQPSNESNSHAAPSEVGIQSGQKLLLEVEGLAIYRDQRTLFSDLTFSLSHGEILGVYGDSGCGKSSLADTLLGLHHDFSGNIDWVQKIEKGQRLKLYQDPPSAHSPHTTLKTLLDDLCALHKLNRSKIPVLLDRLSLDSALLERPSSQVSGGELQRFAILRALLMSPKLLIADEPSSRLDPITAAQTLRLIVEVSKEANCGLILISHDQLALSKLCHKVIDLSRY
ncbi:ABC transporter ATP-binding protein [Vibrio atlanticus]|uniref:ABC transporter ATP-binding protein n=2 Tax=Vibrio TaxID=662 RepID=A0ABV4KMY9_9VIBR|nr:ATP-binding cassette domain-containing protein [Vibrio tasmaniensis]OEF52681.1 ABC transporter ATP-binding protein [Vibrio tasmaniensis 1F-267]